MRKHNGKKISEGATPGGACKNPRSSIEGADDYKDVPQPVHTRNVVSPVATSYV
jgi:hypothetical protein